MSTQSNKWHGQTQLERRASWETVAWRDKIAFTGVLTSYTLTDNNGELVEFDTSGGAGTIYLPANPHDGKTFHFSEIANSATALTVDGNGNNINNAGTLTMNAAFRQRRLRYSTAAAQWIVIGGI